MTTKVVYNNCYGGFGLSKEAINLFTNKLKKMGVQVDGIQDRNISRSDSILIEVVESLGDRANTSTSELVIGTIPNQLINYYDIEEYDGIESITYNLEIFLNDKLGNIDVNNLDPESMKTILLEIQEITRLINS